MQRRNRHRPEESVQQLPVRQTRDSAGVEEPPQVALDRRIVLAMNAFLRP